MMVGIGMTENSLDVMQFTLAHNNIFHVPENVTMSDGHYYYGKAKVITIQNNIQQYSNNTPQCV